MFKTSGDGSSVFKTSRDGSRTFKTYRDGSSAFKTSRDGSSVFKASADSSSVFKTPRDGLLKASRDGTTNRSLIHYSTSPRRGPHTHTNEAERTGRLTPEP